MEEYILLVVRGLLTNFLTNNLYSWPAPAVSVGEAAGTGVGDRSVVIIFVKDPLTPNIYTS